MCSLASRSLCAANASVLRRARLYFVSRYKCGCTINVLRACVNGVRACPSRQAALGTRETIAKAAEYIPSRTSGLSLNTVKHRAKKGYDGR